MRNIFSSLPFLLWKIVEALKQESLQLRKQNEELVKEVDHIQEGRCSDVDEVAYLKWINACLRYELRNYQSALGETTARDLSKTLSPESSKKAKQLVVEYAAKEDQGDRGIHVLELDSNQLSSQEPHLMNSGEFDGTSISNSSAHKSDTSNKSKIFRKLMRLIRGKDHHHNHSEMAHNTEENAQDSRSRTPSPGSSKQFIDFHSFDQGSTTNKGESRNYPTRTMRYSDVGY
ncbi:protein CHUP1, chloroplastic-like [Solanum verrucosum]|uniref:protein CHUP1, chloroplastic-like n=1 Tax=Solanum verrucosum TaxID=315347 RepID=UPI0020D138B8|nr:protein CHUP1, chloroplastic-like [Solanum verrucosum]